MDQRTDDHVPAKPESKLIKENVEQVVEEAQNKVAQSRSPWYQVSRRAQFLIGFNLLIFALFSVLTWFVHQHPIVPVDVAITREFQESNAPWLRVFMVAVSYLGNIGVFFAVLILLTALVFWLVRLRLEAIFIVAVSVVSSIANLLLKYFVNRPRPTSSMVEVMQGASGYSFPSGHVMSYVAFWGLLFCFGLMLFKRDRWWHYALLIVPALFVILVGPSRIYLGDHWASDVLGGYLFGGLILGLSLWLYVALKEHGVLSPRVKKPSEAVTEPPTVPRPAKS